MKFLQELADWSKEKDIQIKAFRVYRMCVKRGKKAIAFNIFRKYFCVPYDDTSVASAYALMSMNIGKSPEINGIGYHRRRL